MTSNRTEEGRVNSISAEQLVAENNRLEEELRKAHEKLGALQKERADGDAEHRREIDALNKKLEGLKPKVNDESGRPVIELELPGLMKIRLSGSAAACFCGMKEGSAIDKS